MQKRYQHYGKGGICWSGWFSIPNNISRHKYQYGTKLINEYR
jgi:hypothetical protein